MQPNSNGTHSLSVVCVTAKTMLRTADLAYNLRNRKVFASSFKAFYVSIKVDFRQTMRLLRKFRAAISDNDSTARYNIRWILELCNTLLAFFLPFNHHSNLHEIFLPPLFIALSFRCAESDGCPVWKCSCGYEIHVICSITGFTRVSYMWLKKLLAI